MKKKGKEVVYWISIVLATVLAIGNFVLTWIAGYEFFVNRFGHFPYEAPDWFYNVCWFIVNVIAIGIITALMTAAAED